MRYAPNKHHQDTDVPPEAAARALDSWIKIDMILFDMKQLSRRSKQFSSHHAMSFNDESHESLAYGHG